MLTCISHTLFEVFKDVMGLGLRWNKNKRREVTSFKSVSMRLIAKHGYCWVSWKSIRVVPCIYLWVPFHCKLSPVFFVFLYYFFFRYSYFISWISLHSYPTLTRCYSMSNPKHTQKPINPQLKFTNLKQGKVTFNQGVRERKDMSFLFYFFL